MEHASLGITVGDESLVISLGDTVWLRSPANRNEDDDPAALEASSSEIYQEDNVDYYGSANNAAIKNASIARIERMWEEPASHISKEQDGRFKIRARWFLKVIYMHSRLLLEFEQAMHWCEGKG